VFCLVEDVGCVVFSPVRICSRSDIDGRLVSVSIEVKMPLSRERKKGKTKRKVTCKVQNKEMRFLNGMQRRWTEKISAGKDPYYGLRKEHRVGV
jgi:hypothetical protein